MLFFSKEVAQSDFEKVFKHGIDFKLKVKMQNVETQSYSKDNFFTF